MVLFSCSDYHHILEVLDVLKESKGISDEAGSERRALLVKLNGCNLTMTNPETPGDGNCLFRALADQVCKTRNYPPTAVDHQVMRHCIIQYMEMNRSDLEVWILYLYCYEHYPNLFFNNTTLAHCYAWLTDRLTWPTRPTDLVIMTD